MAPRHSRRSDVSSFNSGDYTGPETIPQRDQSPPIQAVKDPGKSVFEVEQGWHQKTVQPSGFLGERHDATLETRQELMKKGSAKELRTHALGLWTFLTYAILVILSWTFTCILTYRPIGGAPTYYDQYGNYSASSYETSNRLWRVSSVGSTILAIIIISVTSTMCAKAAAVYCQRMSDVKQPSLTLRKVLILADQGWADLATLRDVIRPSTSRRTASPMLLASAVLAGTGK